MVVAIDGPAGAGKSSVTRKLAQRIGFRFLDTGAMYRAITWAAIDRGVELNDAEAMAVLSRDVEIQFDGDRVLLDQRDVSELVRSPDVTRNVVFAADSKGVRDRLTELQRAIAATGSFVCEGRDQGTVAFPDAFCKIFLTASPQFRAKRRVEQMLANGQYVDFDQVMADQTLRDKQDREREYGALKKADDAIVVDTDDKTIEEVVDEVEKIVKSCLVAMDRD